MCLREGYVSSNTKLMIFVMLNNSVLFNRRLKLRIHNCLSIIN